MTHSLYLGTLQLIGGAATPYLLQVEGMDSGTTWGSPEPVEATLSSFLTDGELVYYKNSQNRTINLVVRVTGTRPNRALAEAALMAQLYKLNTLKWTPPEAGAVTHVFDVLTSHLTPTPDDLRAQRTMQQVYVVELTCRPWVHSAAKTLVSPLPASGTTTTSVNVFSATTGITGTVDGVSVTPSVAGGAVTVASTTSLSGPHTITATIAGAITTSSTKFLVLDWKAGAGNEEPLLSATGDGVTLPKAGSAPSPTVGYTRTWFYVAASSIATSVVFTLSTGPANQDTSVGGGVVVSDVIRSLTMDNLDRTDIRPVLGSAKQQIRTIPILGSAPTVGTIAVQHASIELGDVLLYTCPDDGAGYVPACRTYRVSGNGPTATGTSPSGFYDTITVANSVFDVATGALPDGEYLAMVALTGAVGSPTVLTWSSWARMNATDVSTVDTRTVSFTTSSATVFAFYRLGMIHLPVMDAALGPTSVNRFAISASNASGGVNLADLYLFNLTTGRLTQVSCGVGTGPVAGGPSNRLWLDSPAPENDGLGRILRGVAADRSDAFSAWPSAVSPTVHEMLPGIMKVFTVALNPSTAVDVSYEYYAAGHSSPPA